MAVAFDALGSHGATGAFTTTTASLPWTHTIAAASNAAVVVAVALGANSTTINAFTVSVTCGGTAMTPLGKVQSDNATVGYEQLFGILGQTAGAKSIVVTASGTPTSLAAGSVSFSGAGSFGTSTTNFGSSTAVTVPITPTASGNMITAGWCSGATGTATAGQTSQWIRSGSGASGAGNGGQETLVTTGTTAVNMTATVPSDFWGIVAVEVIAAAAAATAPPRPIRVARQAVSRSYNW